MTPLPTLSGYTFRRLDAPADYPRMAAVINAANAADGSDDLATAEDIASNYRHLENCDPATDTVMAVRNGDLVGYSRTEWWKELDGPRVHAVFAFVHPTTRDDGLADVLLGWSERRNLEVAQTDGSTEIVLEGWVDEGRQEWLRTIYERKGYRAITYGAQMVRPNLDEIPHAELSKGIEIRPVETEHLRTIWEADQDAFRDHFGYSEATEKDFARFLDFPHRDESLWKIAWHGDEVVGQVKSFINDDENEAFGRLRGYTEFISTARAWRKQGIATALICESLRELKSRGMAEAALGVHTENKNGAFRLYESLGFRVTAMWGTYRKTVTVPPTA